MRLAQELLGNGTKEIFFEFDEVLDAYEKVYTNNIYNLSKR